MYKDISTIYNIILILELKLHIKKVTFRLKNNAYSLIILLRLYNYCKFMCLMYLFSKLQMLNFKYIFLI